MPFDTFPLDLLLCFENYENADYLWLMSLSLMLAAVAKYCGNLELCRLTEQVVFSDPYKQSEYNRWTSPYLDNDAIAVREDNALKLEVAKLKAKYWFYIFTLLLFIVFRYPIMNLLTMN